MGIDRITKLLKSCNKKKGKNLTLSVVIGFLLSCTVLMGADFTELKNIFTDENGVINPIEKTADSKTIKIEYAEYKIVITYNGKDDNKQNIDLSLLDEKSYNLLVKELKNFKNIDEKEIITDTQNIADNQFGINKGTLFTDKISRINLNGREIEIVAGQIINRGATGINTGNIFAVSDDVKAAGQYIYCGMGINSGNIFAISDSSDVYGQNIRETGIEINSGNIFIASNNDAYGQDISRSGVEINNGNIFVVSDNNNACGQTISNGPGINNGNIFVFGYDAYGQNIDNGIGINNGVIIADTSFDYDYVYGQKNDRGTAINNGIIIAGTAYMGDVDEYERNGVALKRDDTGKLILSDKAEDNEKIVILNGQKRFEFLSTAKREKNTNLFLNNLGTDENGAESDTAKNNQLTLNTNLSANFSDTHVTTAVTNGNFDNSNGAVVKLEEKLTDFTMDKSTMAGYFEQNGTLADMNGAKNITLNDSVISAFGKDKDVKVTAVKFGEGTTVSLNNSAITGNTVFGDEISTGENKLNLNAEYHGIEEDRYINGTQFMTSVDSVAFNGNSNDTINITTEQGTADRANKSGKGFVSLGDVNFGAGDDTLKFDFTDYINGNFVISGTVDFGNNEIKNTEKDKIEFSSALNMTEWKGVYTDNDNTNIAKNLTFLNTLLENTKNLEILQLADGGNTFYFEGTDKEGNSVTFNFDGTVSGGKGADTFVLNSDLMLKELDGGEGTDTLQIGENGTTRSNSEIKLSGKISNFENINVINRNIHIDADTELNNIANINMNGNNLTLGIDYTDINSDGKVKGHALYDKKIEDMKFIGTENFMIDVSEVTDSSKEYIISHGDYDFSAIKDKVTGNSSNHKVSFSSNGDILVNVEESIVSEEEKLNPKYASLNKIYQSILSADKLEKMEKSYLLNDGKTKEEAIKAQLEFYGKIYHSTPYAYSHEISEKSAELITNSLINNKTMPEFKKWIFGGSIAGQEADSDNNFYGTNYYGVDNTKAEADIESSIYGAYAFGEYGIQENQSVGFAVAGTKSDTDISGNSKIKGNSVFVSAYAKQEINNLKMIAGLGYQHGFYDSTRTVSNDYQSMSVDKKYEDDMFTIFAGAGYSYSLGSNFFLEPNAKLNISHTMQNDINETDRGDLSIKVEEQDFTSVDTEIGLDLVKKINLQKGILNLKLGASFIYSLEGHEEEYITAKITGATKDFEIISPESDREKGRFNIGTEYETETGMFYNLHGNYITSSHETDYCVSFGAGFTF